MVTEWEREKERGRKEEIGRERGTDRQDEREGMEEVSVTEGSN